MKDIYRKKKTYYGKFKNEEIKAKNIIEEKIFTIKDYRYIKHMNNPPMTYQGKTLKQWSEITGMRKGTIYDRIHTYKWTFEKAVSEPLKYIKTYER